jgi:hypothetical protein
MINKLLFALGMLNLTLQLNAITLNKKYVDKSTDYTITDSQVAQINDHLLFNQIYNFEMPFKLALYSMHTETQDVVKLLDGETSNPEGDQHFFRLGNHVYFTNWTGQETTVWQTDGTPEGTSQIYANGIMSGLKVSNGLLYFSDVNTGQMVTYDGTQIVQHEVLDISFDIDDVCAFTGDNIIAIGFAEGVGGPYLQSNAGNVTELDLELPITINGYELNFTSHNGSCYTHVPNSAAGTDIWKFNADGSSELLLTLQNGITSGLLSHQGRLYIRQINDQFLGLKISRLSADETMVDATYGDLNTQDLFITEWTSLGESIAIRTTTPNASPAVDTVLILSSSLADFPQQQVLFPTAMPRAFETQDGWILQIGQILNGIKPVNQLITNPFSSDQSTLLLPEGTAYQFTSDPNRYGVYMLAYDGLKTTLYQTADQPDIGPIITGGWYNPNIENQGLNIIQGTRFNGSEYVSVTGYTYKDGLPFWFAGNADIQAPQNSIDIELFEFSGIGMFEADNTPTRTSYGTINLQMNGCNELNSIITTADEAFEMPLYRADDVSFTQNCVD